MVIKRKFSQLKINKELELTKQNEWKIFCKIISVPNRGIINYNKNLKVQLRCWSGSLPIFLYNLSTSHLLIRCKCSCHLGLQSHKYRGPFRVRPVPLWRFSTVVNILEDFRSSSVLALHHTFHNSIILLLF